MANDWSDLTKRVARGIAEVRKTTGAELVAESQPVPLAGRIAGRGDGGAGCRASCATMDHRRRPAQRVWKRMPTRKARPSRSE